MFSAREVTALFINSVIYSLEFMLSLVDLAQAILGFHDGYFAFSANGIFEFLDSTLYSVFISFRRSMCWDGFTLSI